LQGAAQRATLLDAQLSSGDEDDEYEASIASEVAPGAQQCKARVFACQRCLQVISGAAQRGELAATWLVSDSPSFHALPAPLLLMLPGAGSHGSGMLSLEAHPMRDT
jgi:hypothetical protein